MLLSKSCAYALRASIYVAAVSNGYYVSVNQTSKKLDISFHFLTKILQRLTQNGLMESMKGPNGGVKLKRPAEQIYLADIVKLIDGEELLVECALGLPGCGTAKPCPLHHQWADTRDVIKQMLEGTTIADLVREGREGKLRITKNGGFEWK